MTVHEPTPPPFRPPFRGWMRFGVATGLVLLALFSAARFGLVMQANVTKDYGPASLLFVVMALVPLILLTGEGRRRIGMVRPTSLRGVAAGFFLGALACAAMVATAGWLFGSGDDNAFVYIAGTYSGLPSPMDDRTRLILFAVFALIGMTFSPVGEELFYRGLVHETLTGRFGEGRASLFEAGAFALVHVAHFGLIWRTTGWTFLVGPAIWWVAGLFVTGLVFSWARRASGSILGAILAHAGFNLTMTAWIFYGVL